MSDRLSEIEGRLADATKGPWIESANLHPNGTYDYGIATEHDENDVCTFPYTPQGSADMEFIAHAPADLADLVKFARAVQDIAASLALHGAMRVQVPSSDIGQRLAGALSHLEHP